MKLFHTAVESVVYINEKFVLNDEAVFERGKAVFLTQKGEKYTFKLAENE